MKKYVTHIAAAVAVFIIATVVSIIITAWYTGLRSNSPSRTHNESTFVSIESCCFGDLRILYDRDTKVIYVYNYKGGLFPLYNADGSLKLYEGE